MLWGQKTISMNKKSYYEAGFSNLLNIPSEEIAYEPIDRHGRYGLFHKINMRFPLYKLNNLDMFNKKIVKSINVVKIWDEFTNLYSRNDMLHVKNSSKVIISYSLPHEFNIMLENDKHLILIEELEIFES